MGKGWKIAISVILSVIFIGCLPFNIWYFVLLSKSNDTVVSYTYEVGLQTLTDSSSSKYFIEVNYHSNEDGNGREVLDIKFNYMLDENQTAFFSQGLQYVAYEGYEQSFETVKEIGFSSKHNAFGWLYTYTTYTVCGKYLNYAKYNYMSSDDYETPLLSTNPIHKDTMFKIQIGDNLFGMKFKGETNDTGFYKSGGGVWRTEYTRNLDRYDIDYFVARLFTSIKSLPNGTSRALCFEFGDLFDYFEYSPEEGKYTSQITDVERLKTLITDVKSYYSILVNKTADGVVCAKDSLFNMVEGNAGFNISKVVLSDDYFVGRSIINCSLDDFNKVKIADNYIALKLTDDFVNNFEKYSDKIRLNILIDLDKLKNETFVGFTKDSNLNKFVVESCQTVKTIDGQKTYEVVAYE